MVTFGDECRATSAPRRRAGWAWYLVANGLGVIVYYSLPRFGLSAVQNLWYTGFTAASCLAIVIGCRINRRGDRLPWYVLAAAQFSYVVADALFWVEANVRHVDPFPGLPDVFYLLQCPLLVAALVIFIRRRTPGWHGASLIDASIVATGVALVWWVFVVSPLTTAPGLTSLARAVSIAYPVMDLLVLVVVLRLMLGAGNRPLAYYLLALSMALMLAGDVVYAIGEATDSFVDNSWPDLTWIGSYAALGAAALHPSMRQLDRSLAVPPPEAGRARIAGLATAALLAPAVLYAQYLRGTPTHLPAIALACTVLFLLVLLRMAGMVRAQRLVAITDSLTGLYSRRFFEEALRVEAERAARGRTALAVLITDVDHFKAINDTHGHPAGDRVLRELASRLRDGCRPGDVLARYGGEEFAVLLPDTDTGRAVEVAERIRAHVAAAPLWADNERPLAVTVSIGVASLSGDSADLPTVVQAADRALYAAKSAGRNRVTAAPAPMVLSGAG